MAFEVIVNSEVTVGPHEVYDVGGITLQTGEAANITATLVDPDYVASAIAVTVTEIGATGAYSATFTPDAVGNWKLKLTNPAGSDENVAEYVVSAVGVSTSGETDSYCSEAQVVAVAQYLTDFTGSTKPTQVQVLIFMAQRAGELYAILYDVMGTEAPGPASYSVTVDTTTDVGKALNFVLQQENAIGAAFDALQAAGAGETPARSERVAELWAMWKDGNESLRRTATMYQSSTSTSATHISIGEITEKSVTAREEDGLTFTGATEW